MSETSSNDREAHAFAGALTGRTALVTGATRGIGRGIALALGKAGARVIVTGRGETNGQAVVEELRQYSGGGFIAADLTDDRDVDSLIPAVLDQYGDLDILVNNAGIDADNPFLEHPLEDWRRVLKVNLEVPFRLSQAAARHLVAKKRGVIINISSVYGTVSTAEAGSYAASKHGLNGLSKTMAIELASSGVRVNVVAPGLIKTDMTEDIWGAPGFDIAARMPVGRIGVPEDVAGAVVFLASDAADFIHGHVLTVDGGRLIR